MINPERFELEKAAQEEENRRLNQDFGAYIGLVLLKGNNTSFHYGTSIVSTGFFSPEYPLAHRFIEDVQFSERQLTLGLHSVIQVGFRIDASENYEFVEDNGEVYLKRRGVGIYGFYQDGTYQGWYIEPEIKSSTIKDYRLFTEAFLSEIARSTLAQRNERRSNENQHEFLMYLLDEWFDQHKDKFRPDFPSFKEFRESRKNPQPVE